MVKLYDGGAYLVNGTEIVPEAEAAKVEAHNTSGNMEGTAESGQSHYIRKCGRQIRCLYRRYR